MNVQTFGFILAGVLLNAGAQLLLKAGVRPLGPITLQSSTAASQVFAALTQLPVVAGLGCYVVSVVLWIVALSRVDVSIAYPMLSIGYVVNALAAWWLFGETLAVQQGIGIGFILVGVWLLAH
jgi:multidrug transporter EmrE-like cation transporter